MTKTTEKEAPPAPIPTPDARQEAQDRAETCGREVAAILEKHRCRIVATLTDLEPVGKDGSRAIIGTTTGIMAY